jgi:hypothetical protein
MILIYVFLSKRRRYEVEDIDWMELQRVDCRTVRDDERWQGIPGRPMAAGDMHGNGVDDHAGDRYQQGHDIDSLVRCLLGRVTSRSILLSQHVSPVECRSILWWEGVDTTRLSTYPRETQAWFTHESMICSMRECTWASSQTHALSTRPIFGLLYGMFDKSRRSLTVEYRATDRVWEDRSGCGWICHARLAPGHTHTTSRLVFNISQLCMLEISAVLRQYVWWSSIPIVQHVWWYQTLQAPGQLQ